MNLPRITIVTPVLNQADRIESTIQSVISQGYPDLNYTIIDGGSTDHTIDIIKRYEPFLTH
jgi:glycosyltransferase involved in cell wall biosynthesis